jgi:hypothetical protein
MTVEKRCRPHVQTPFPTPSGCSTLPMGDRVDIKTSSPTHLSDEQRIDWLRLIRSDNVGPRGLRAHLQPNRCWPWGRFFCLCRGVGGNMLVFRAQFPQGL